MAAGGGKDIVPGPRAHPPEREVSQERTAREIPTHAQIFVVRSTQRLAREVEREGYRVRERMDMTRQEVRGIGERAAQRAEAHEQQLANERTRGWGQSWDQQREHGRER